MEKKMEKKVFGLKCLTTLVQNLPSVIELGLPFALVYYA